MRWVSSFTLGVLLLGLSVAGGIWIVNPGDLTNQHSEIGGCSSCHSEFDSGIRGWLHAALRGSDVSKDSERCTSCHQFGNNAMRPHSISSDATQRLTESAQPPTEADGPLFVKVGTTMFGRAHLSGELGCMTCHREHKGSDFDLTRMSNQNCVSCHSAQFSSFSGGHPEFSDYPYERRTRIKFDHVSHIRKHFQETNFSELAPVGCNSCHRPDPKGRTMQVNGFERVCGDCHIGQIVGDSRASAKGILVFGVPGLDLETLYDRGVSLGEWPEFAEEPVSVFTEMLLSADPDFIDAYRAVQNLDFLDLTDQNDEILEQVVKVAWSFKELTLDLTTRGADALRQRLETVISRPLEDNEIADLVAMFPVDMMLNAQQNWFPSLGNEVARHRRSENVSNPGEILELDQVTSKSGEAVILSAPATNDNLLSDGEENLFADGDDDLFVDGEENLFADGDDDLFAGGDDDLFAAEEDDDLLAGEDDDGLGTPLAKEIGINFATNEDWMSFGGWYRDELVLRYRPTGHNDRFFYRWINLASEAHLDQSARLLEILSSEQAPGVCFKCHSVDRTVNGDRSLTMNWTGRRIDTLTHPFTSFSHTSHFSLLGEKGCFSCHQLDNESDFMSGFEDRNSATFSSNFNPIQRSTCSECHKKEKAGDDCLSCHNYHIGKFQPTDLVHSQLTADPQ